MTARRPRLDDASEAYVQRVVATFPPFTESDKLRLSWLVTPPNRIQGITAKDHDVRDVHRDAGDVDAAA